MPKSGHKSHNSAQNSLSPVNQRTMDNTVESRSKETLQRLSLHRGELERFTDFTRKQELKYKAGIISFEIETLKNCQQYLAKLKKIVRKSGIESFFGVHVLLQELDSLYDDSIRNIKENSNNYNTDMTSENVNELLETLERDLLKSSFLKFDDSQVASENVIYLESNFSRKESFDELVKYFSVGTTLKTDYYTLLLLGELRKLRTNYPEISPFSAIIGPSYMGKTQTAFTLANVINVIYVNFISVESICPQPIYSLFTQFSSFFESTTLIDKSGSRYILTKGRSQDLFDSNWSFQTLGLIYVIIRMRKLRPELDGLEWLKEVVNINKAMIPPMTRKDFISKTEDIELENQLIFIDELPRNNKNLVASIKFLRNLCRAVRLPVNISGTDSRIRNMIALEDASESRIGDSPSYPWVQVTVQTPKSSLMKFCHLIKFKPHNSEIASSCLKDFVHPITEKVQYPQLFRNVYGSADTKLLNQVAPVKKLIDFLIKQSGTCLPGIITLIFTKLFEMLPGFTYDSKRLWKDLATAVITGVMTRKLSMKKPAGLLDSAHILTFPTPEFFKKSLEKGDFSTCLVEEHLFRYGAKGDTTFRLDLSLDPDANDIVIPGFLRDGARFVDKCNFPELNEDFFTTFVSLGVWNMAVAEFEQETGTRRCTLATLYQDYLEILKGHVIGVDPKTVDSFTLELLSHWSICHASHLNFNGETGGVELFTEFVKNLQKLDNSVGWHLVPVTLKGLSNLPKSLVDILNRVQVPFLMRFAEGNPQAIDAAKEELKDSLGDFIKLGRSYLPETMIGWDVLFDMNFDKEPCSGFIECKLWKKAVGYAKFLKYYNKACKDAHPLSFLVCQKLQKHITSSDAASKLEEKLRTVQNANEDEKDAKKLLKEEEGQVREPLTKIPKISLKETSKKTTKKPKKDYFALLRGLWADPESHINIYAVKYKNIPEFKEGSFTVSALKSFPNPKGAFILVESSFNPPLRSSRSR